MILIQCYCLVSYWVGVQLASLYFCAKYYFGIIFALSIIFYEFQTLLLSPLYIKSFEISAPKKWKDFIC